MPSFSRSDNSVPFLHSFAVHCDSQECIPSVQQGLTVHTFTYFLNCYVCFVTILNKQLCQYCRIYWMHSYVVHAMKSIFWMNVKKN